MEYTVWQIIYKKLEEAGIAVYSMGQCTGECKSPYVVVSNSGASPDANYSSQVVYYSIMCYVPLSSYSALEGFIEEVKKVLKELFPMIRPDGIENPSTIDDDVKAYMVSIEYVNYKKMKYL